MKCFFLSTIFLSFLSMYAMENKNNSSDFCALLEKDTNALTIRQEFLVKQKVYKDIALAQWNYEYVANTQFYIENDFQ